MEYDNERLPHTPPWRHVLSLSLACLVIVSVGLWDSYVLSQGEMPQPRLPREYMQGFECGVRYGLIAQRLEPEEDDIPTLTRMAKLLLAQIAKHSGTEAMTCPQDDK